MICPRVSGAPTPSITADLAAYIRAEHPGSATAESLAADVEADTSGPEPLAVGEAESLVLAVNFFVSVAIAALFALRADPGNPWWRERLHRAVGEAVECRRMLAGRAP